MFTAIILTAGDKQAWENKKQGFVNGFGNEDFYAFELKDGTFALPEANLSNPAFSKFKDKIQGDGLLNGITIRVVTEDELLGWDDD